MARKKHGVRVPLKLCWVWGVGGAEASQLSPVQLITSLLTKTELDHESLFDR